jgi:hypothetical protein
VAESVAVHFARFAETARRRAPLYARLSTALAQWPGLDGLYADAPAPARVPVTLFAAVHYLLLERPDDPLARFYPNLAGERTDPGDPVPEFLAFCSDRADELRALVSTRLPQTNEIGRACLLVAGFGTLPPGPKAHLDVGTSAGLNLMLDRLAYSDGAGVIGNSDLVLECSVRPDGSRLAAAPPAIASRLGLDANPIDLTDASDSRWLEACVWPDQADRFQRLERAIALFRSDPVPVRRGDAVADLATALDELDDGAPVVTTSWALCYLDAAAQGAWEQELERIGAAVDLTWVWVESPVQVPVLPTGPAFAGSDATLLGVSTWRGGVRSDRVLARCHPHGYWLGWL